MDDLIKRCVCEGYEYQMHVWEQMNAGDVALSDVFQRRMERLIRRNRQSKVLREVRRYAVGAAAMFGVIILLLRPEYAVNAFDMIMEWFKDHVRFELPEESNTGECPRYSLGYIPEGYVIQEEIYYDNVGTVVCFKDSVPLYFSYALSEGEMNVDNEDAAMVIEQLSDGRNVYCLIGEGEKATCSASWLSEDETIMFNIIGQVSMEEIIKICENISEIL